MWACRNATGAERGTFAIPQTLRTSDGCFDAYSLLKAMAQTAGNPVLIPGDVIQMPIP